MIQRQCNRGVEIEYYEFEMIISTPNHVKMKF